MHEVRAASKAQHPEPRVLDIGYWQGTNFVVSEYVPGPTFDKLVTEKGPLAPHAACTLIAQAAIGLYAAINWASSTATSSRETSS